MADNTRGGSQDAANPLIATDEVTYSGDTADVALLRPVHVTGAEGSKTVVDITTADGIKALTQKALTATGSNVASSASSVTLLAANNARLGATIFNESTQVLYVKFGTTASATDYLVQLVASAYYEVPFGYVGRIDGIWASANGNARVVELT